MIDADLTTSFWKIMYAVGWSVVQLTWQGAIVAGVTLGLLAIRREKTPCTVRYRLLLTSLVSFLLIAGATSLNVLAAYDSTTSPMSVFLHTSTLDPMLPFLGWIGILGCGAAIVRFLLLLRNYVESRRLRRESLEGPPELSAILQTALRRMGMSIGPSIGISTAVDSPLLLGWRRPMILIPRGVLSNLSSEQTSTILMHELSHLKKRDPWQNLVQAMIEALFFLHPAVHWLSRRIRVEREIRCDESVLAHGAQRTVYARALGKIALYGSGETNPSLSATGGEVFRRIQSLAKPKTHPPHEAISTVVRFVLLLATIVGLSGCDLLPIRVVSPSEPAMTLESETEAALVVPGQLSLDALLDRARKASGWSRASGWTREDGERSLRLAGKASYLGVVEKFESDFAQDGRFRQRFEGELFREVRYDGRDVRRAEQTTLWQNLAFFAKEAELLRAWVHGGFWLDPQAPLTIEMSASPQKTPGILSLDLRLRSGKITATVELGSKDSLVRALTLPTGNELLRTEYSNYESIDGVRVAQRVHCALPMGREYTLLVRQARFEESSADRFQAMEDRPDFRFDTGIAPDVKVIRSKSKHLWVRPTVDGKDVGLFLFDTGAGFSGISREAADKLGMARFGKTSITGLGGSRTETALRRANSLQLGPLIIESPVFSEIPVERKETMVGEKVGGVLGWDVMRRAIVDLEPRGKLRLYDPSKFDPTKFNLPPDNWLPLDLHYKVPYLRARFSGGHEGLFMLDCGAAGMTVFFFFHASKNLGLLRNPETPSVEGHGAGGTFHHRLDELPWFEFAGKRLKDMTIILSTREDGEADPYSLGLIGGGLLRLYRLVFDYSRQRVTILPV